MKQTIVSNMIAETLNETYTYLNSIYETNEMEILKQKLCSLAGFSPFSFSLTAGKYYSYEQIQETLAALNEKESIRKSKGVYYTPPDVVRFIVNNSIKSAYGILSTDGLKTINLEKIPYRSFCVTKTILDPTSGAGEFLLAVLETKFELLDELCEDITEEVVKSVVSTIFGNDINMESVIITKIRLFLCALRRYGVKKCISIDNILNNNFWNMDFVFKTPDLGRKFDIIIGNPPYVEDSKYDLPLDKKYGNIYANVLNNAAELLNDDGVIGFVIPLSYVSTPRMKKIREKLFEIVPEQYILSYSDRPDCLFKSVHQKLCILIGKKIKCEKKRIFTGNYQYWYKQERKTLFDNTIAVKNNFAGIEYIPKLGNITDVEVYEKIYNINNSSRLIDLQSTGAGAVYVNMRAAFWIKAFRQKHIGSEYRCFNFSTTELADYFSCLINSSLFWWYWVCVSDCWHITNKELQGFMVPLLENYETVTKLADMLENKLEETKLYVGTRQTEYEYKHKACVQEIHSIDDYINDLYNLSDAESLYIKNFAHRYRVSGGVK